MPRSARALVVELTADTKDFIKGTQAADKALDKFTTSGAKGLDNLERHAQDAANEIAHGKTKETFGEAGSEVGAEFATNLGSSLAAGDITTIAQDTAGGLVSAFTAIGGPIGIALAGVATGATLLFANMQKKAEQAAERISAVFDNLTQDVQSAMSENIRMEWLNTVITQLGGDKGLAGGVKKINEWAQKAHTTFDSVVAAIAAGPGATNTLIARLKGVVKEGTTIQTQGKTVVRRYSEAASNAQHLLDWLGQANGEISEGIGLANTYKGAFENAQTATALTVENINKINRGLRIANQNPIAPKVLRG